jgi:hypothetical protein
VNSNVPLWVTVVLSIAPSVVAVAAIVTAELSNRRSLTAAREAQDRELEERRWATLRDERIRAYAALARLTKQVNVSASQPELPAVAEAHSEVELLADNPNLRQVADDLFFTWEGAWRSVRRAIDAGEPDPYNMSGYKNVRELLRGLWAAFIELAREEIKATPREETTQGSTTTDASAGAQKPAQRRPWWER